MSYYALSDAQKCTKNNVDLQKLAKIPGSKKGNSRRGSALNVHVIHFFIAQVWQCSPNCLAGVAKRAIFYPNILINIFTIKLLVLRGKLMFFFQFSTQGVSEIVGTITSSSDCLSSEVHCYSSFNTCF